jgi:hypothetical protein
MTQTTLLDRFKALADTMTDDEVKQVVQYAEILEAIRDTAISAPSAEAWQRMPEETRQEVYKQLVTDAKE